MFKIIIIFYAVPQKVRILIADILAPICCNPYQDFNSEVIEMKMVMLKVRGSLRCREPH